MNSRERVMKWIKDTFDDLSEVIIEDYSRLPYGKKITDFTNDYVIVFFDNDKKRVNFLFKDQ